MKQYKNIIEEVPETKQGIYEYYQAILPIFKEKEREFQKLQKIINECKRKAKILNFQL